MSPGWVVERFNVFEHAQSSRVQVGILTVIRPLVFEAPEEPLGHRVVVAVPGAAHRTRDPECLQRPLVGRTRVLTAAVAVMQQLGAVGTASLDSIPQGRLNQLGRQ